MSYTWMVLDLAHSNVLGGHLGIEQPRSRLRIVFSGPLFSKQLRNIVNPLVCFNIIKGDCYRLCQDTVEICQGGTSTY